MSKSNQYLLISILLFFCLVLIGLWLSHIKPLWNDEIYTQTRNIDKRSYAEIISGKITEGNLSPLFHVIQKIVCDTAQYTFPETWDGRWYYADPKSQYLLRIPSIVYLSFGLTCLFYYFVRTHSWITGLLSLIIALSTFTVWEYWAEARPYSLWYSLSILQSLYFIRILKNDDGQKNSFIGLSVIHFLMSLTVVVSLVQIVLISGLIWIFKERGLKHYILMTVIPAGICLFFYLRSPIVGYKLIDPFRMVYANYPLEYLCFLGLFLMTWTVKKVRQHSAGQVKIVGPYILYAVLLVAGTFAMLLIIRMKESAFGPLPTRTFLFLAPASIIMTTLCFTYLLNALKDKKWLYINTAIIMSGLIILRVVNTYETAVLSGIF